MSKNFTAELMSPCGIYCGTCIAFFGYTMAGKKRKMSCIGCRSRISKCAFLKKGCSKLASKQVEYCFECESFPCERLKAIDVGYLRKYGMSLVENLKHIQSKGINSFLKTEQEKRKCPTCGGVICVHTNKCYGCNEP
ncbi:MAG: DUF3795 domain-containing protein [Candidatus Bathyarchaeota archaeon]|nr:DUF3795 domain-containing protein [Candidatus Bathyarchaeum sp.]